MTIVRVRTEPDIIAFSFDNGGGYDVIAIIPPLEDYSSVWGRKESRKWILR